MASSNMQEKLAASLQKGANPILKITGDNSLYDRLFRLISSFYKDKTSFQKDLPKLKKLSLQYDYRLIALYIWAVSNQKRGLLKCFEKMLQPGQPMDEVGNHIYGLAFQRFSEISTKKVSKPDLSFKRSIQNLISFSESSIAVYLYDKKYKEILTDFVNKVDGKLSDFINIQLDIPNRNAAIRPGDVKQWNLPDGTYVVSKKMKPGKIEKFIREQKNCYKLIRTIPNSEFKINSSDKDKKIYVNIVTPFALVNDNHSGNIYAFYKKQPGISLEEVLYSTKSKSARRRYLVHFKLIMDELLTRGIWWGDMSPRNILVEESKGRLSYALLDFEKTRISRNSVSEKKRVELWRGQVFIEELCVICSFEEVLEVFRNYFDPSGWDVNSERRIPFNLRPDIKTLLAGRDIKYLKLGEYNSLDQKILSVRKPRIVRKSHELYYPGTIGFKVEHYLSSIGDDAASDYDRKTTEVLLAARKHEVFDKIAQMLLQKTRKLEIKLLELEFSALLKKGVPNSSFFPEMETNQLKIALDKLYKNRKYRSFYLKFGNEEY